MRSITVLAIIALAMHGVAHAKEWQCRDENDPTFSVEDRRIVREARKYAEKRTDRVYTCFNFATKMKDGSGFLDLDRPTTRDGKSITAIGAGGTVRLDKNGTIVEYLGGR